MTNITDPIAARAGEMPGAPALLTAKATLSYAELDGAVSAAASGFAKAGLTAGDFAGIHLADQVQHVIASLALARLGAGQIAFDDSDPQQLQRALAEKLDLAAIVAGPADKTATGVRTIAPPSGDLLELKTIAATNFTACQDGARPFLVMRSSGTTGVPKLAILSNEAALKRLQSHGVDLPSGPGCRFLSMININFHGVKQRFLHCLASGGCFAVFEGKRARALVNFVTRHRVNYISGVPNHAAILLRIASKDRLLLPGLDAFRVGATVVPDGLRKDIQQRLTPNLFVGYGSNEAGAIAMAPPALVKTIPGVVGNIVPGMEIEIIDGNGRPLPPGKTGTVRLKSDGMISGYIDAPEETAQAFKDGWFYPGDLAEFTEDGVLVHRGRADDMMIFNGINISPLEIENMLLRHPAVAEVAAFPVHSAASGAVPVSAVVTKTPVSKGELMAYAETALGVHRPQHIMLVSELPRNAVGKILKKKLAQKFLRHGGKS